MRGTRRIADRGYPFLWAAEVQRDGSDTLEIVLVGGAARRFSASGADPVDVMVSLDDGSSWELLAQAVRPGAFGNVVTPPADGSPNEIQIGETALLDLDSGELESATLERISFQGANRMIWGEEVVSYVDAAPASTPGQWELTTLLRGMAGTEPESAASLAGKRWAALDARATWIQVEPSWMGQTLLLAPSTPAWPWEAHPIRATVTIDGRSARPITPTLLEGAWLGSDFGITWHPGRELFGPPTTEIHSGSRPTQWYEVEYQRADTTWRRYEIASPVPSAMPENPAHILPAAEATADGHTSGDPMAFRVRAVNWRGASPWAPGTT